MTVGSQLAQALAGAKGLEAQMMMFAEQTQNQNAKAMFEQLATTMCDVTQALEQRYQEVQGEEPTY